MTKRRQVDLAAAMQADLSAQETEGQRSHEPKGKLDQEKNRPEAAGGVAPSRIGMKRIQGYFSPRVKRQLRILAAESDVTEEQLVGRALNLLFEANGLPAIAFDRKEPGRGGR